MEASVLYQGKEKRMMRGLEVPNGISVSNRLCRRAAAHDCPVRAEVGGVL